MSTNRFDSDDPALFDIATHVPGPAGSLPLTEEMLRERFEIDHVTLQVEHAHTELLQIEGTEGEQS